MSFNASASQAFVYCIDEVYRRRRLVSGKQWAVGTERAAERQDTAAGAMEGQADTERDRAL